MAYTALTELLKGNAYAGRGIMIGRTQDGKQAVVVYFIMGRSENSRNRVFKEEGEGITIYPFDASKVKDPSLIIYSPIRTLENRLVVTNGDQTDTICDYLSEGLSFEAALRTRTYEPDDPNFTPRISGMVEFDGGEFAYSLSVLKKQAAGSDCCTRQTFEYCGVPGQGHFVHTYVHDGDPLPSFAGEPKAVAVPNDTAAFAKDVWEALNAENKISLCVKGVDLKTGETKTYLFNKNV